MANQDNGTVEPANSTQRTRSQVEGAWDLARYVIEYGVTDDDGKALAYADIATIENTAAMLGIIDVKGSGAGATTTGITTDQWNGFEQAYYRLSIATRPVTAETLRNTRYAAGAGGAARQGSCSWSNILTCLRGNSPAQSFTHKLWVITILAALVVMATEVGINALGMKTNPEKYKVWQDLLQWIQPWAYGALGSCAYLLRSAHYFIYARSFDLRRAPEYYNRILLGAISGGAIILFADYLSSEEDAVTHIGTTALGFIAGYSTDFLFNTVERIVTALFPKVDMAPVPQDQPPKKPGKPNTNGDGPDGTSQ